MEYHVTLPSKPRIVTEEGHTGLYEIDGLFPGYGHTLGNSLRRIILSSLPGAAITSVTIDGAPHEFSALEGVKEDVITMLLNLKRVRLALHTDEAQILTLNISGPKSVTAGDIAPNGQVSILNPDQHIAEVTGKVTLSIEMRIEQGLGYVSREIHQEERVEIGAIALDATFSPIRRVNYEVENMRVGDRTDFNRLRIFIETDGTVTPRQALERAIETLIHQLKAIIGFKEEERGEEIETATVVEQERDMAEEGTTVKASPDQELLKTRIETLKLSSRTISALGGANIRTIGGLARKKEEDILAIEGLGIKGLQEIKRALGEYGITLK